MCLPARGKIIHSPDFNPLSAIRQQRVGANKIRAERSEQETEPMCLPAKTFRAFRDFRGKNNHSTMTQASSTRDKRFYRKATTNPQLNIQQVQNEQMPK
ncbi:hypothetical protein [uncultured Gimesia sp.]|uniref:hypothetical protein n=1 Tax=uncultured Gimesia sp. TaxID=1678688 RepID=UPI0026124B7C|nr:hypothetical protein [uncultured Gimesia sp.]